jgi:hypothetical protein
MCGAVMMCVMRYYPRVTNEIVDVVEGTDDSRKSMMRYRSTLVRNLPIRVNSAEKCGM